MLDGIVVVGFKVLVNWGNVIFGGSFDLNVVGLIVFDGGCYFFVG